MGSIKMNSLVEGYYKAVGTFYLVLKNEKGKFTASTSSGTEYPVTVEYGDFGAAHPEVQRRSGMANYNIKITLRLSEENQGRPLEGHEYGIVYDGGRYAALKGTPAFASLEKITEEELEEIRNDFDPIEAPPGPYKLHPEKLGRILWLTGSPGMGKSTSAQLLARSHGYVYYEADCFGSLRNPYVPLEVADPSVAQMHQKALNGPGCVERKATVLKGRKAMSALVQGNDWDKKALLEYYRIMAADIAREKRRIGGSFAVAHVLISPEVRAVLREELGPDLIIVVLTMNNVERRQRILTRHGGESSFTDLMDMFAKKMDDISGVENDEPNTIELLVDDSMTREDVVDKIKQKLEEIRF